MYLQDLIFELQRFWASQGCIIQQPLDIEVGAGTFDPATLLRVLGPEPYSTAFVQPCRRPTDGRYGENPNRLGAYGARAGGHQQIVGGRAAKIRRARAVAGAGREELRHVVSDRWQRRHRHGRRRDSGGLDVAFADV